MKSSAKKATSAGNNGGFPKIQFTNLANINEAIGKQIHALRNIRLYSKRKQPVTDRILPPAPDNYFALPFSYRAPYCSKVSIFYAVTTILTFVPPLLIAYRSQGTQFRIYILI